MVTRFSFISRSGSSFIVLFALLGGAFLRFHKLGEVPPGLHYDFAANAIIANGIAFEGWREVFITAYTGKEVLFFYTAGLIFKFVGSSIFALQFTAALYGILGIAACYFAARQLLWDDPDSKWIAALAAVILSFTFMHLVWSRYGERAVAEPFVQGLAVGFLFRGLRHSHASKFPYSDFILAGAFTGLTAYTYLAARLFPIPIAITLIVVLIQQIRRLIAKQPKQPNHLTTFLAQLGAYLAAAALVFDHRSHRFVAVVRHDDLRLRTKVEIPQHVAGRQRGDQQVFRIPARGIAAKCRIGRAEQVRPARRRNHMVARIGPVVRGPLTQVSGPLGAGGIAVLFVVGHGRISGFGRRFAADYP